MQIINLKLVNYRNYDKLNINFSEKFNLIYGKNGMGKTNLVESIYVLALTKSFRSSVDKVLIKENSLFAKVEAEVMKNRLNTYRIVISNDGKRVKINNNNINKLSEYISLIGVIIFNPDDLRIIKDSPNTRRKALNIDISQINNKYLSYLNNYNKILKQRNTFLKNAKVESNQYIESLNEQLISYGLRIYNERKKIIELINSKTNYLYKKIMNKGNLEIKYVSDYDNKSYDDLISMYKDNYSRDLIVRSTLLGIHKDDFLFYLDDHLMKDYASEGQQKNAIIAYKFALISIFESINSDLPILILDDLFSELDVEKINNILKLIDSRLQVFITTTEIDNVDSNIIEKSKLFLVENGLIKEGMYE